MDQAESDDELKRIPNHDGRGVVGKVVRVRSGVLDAREYRMLFIGNERTPEARECGNQSTDIFPARETFGEACGSAGENPKTCRGGAAIELFAREEITGWDCWGNEV